VELCFVADAVFVVCGALVAEFHDVVVTCRHSLSEQPLMTQATRQMHLEAQMSRYKRVIIRIQFPDRLVMQAVFRTTETGRHEMLLSVIHSYIEFIYYFYLLTLSVCIVWYHWSV